MVKKILFAVSLLIALTSEGQNGLGSGLPITLKVNTPGNLPFGSVEFTGFTQSIQDEPPLVYLEIKTPAGSIEQLSSRADKATGIYLIKYFCKALGQYEATTSAVIDLFLAVTAKCLPGRYRFYWQQFELSLPSSYHLR